MSEQQDGGAGFLAGFIIGAVLGAGLALVFAPQPGTQTREFLREKSIELKSKAADASAQARPVAEDLVQTGKSFVEQQKAKIQEAISEGKAEAERIKSEMLSKFETTTEAG